jgi:WD40 repeat protein
MMSSRRLMSAAVCIFAVSLSALVCGLLQNTGLREELAQQSAAEGLALICVRNSGIDIHSFDLPYREDRSPRSDSVAWFSGDGRFVAWEFNGLAYHKSLWGGPSPLIVEAIDGSESWQLSGRLLSVSALGISTDGKRIAFFGTHRPSSLTTDGDSAQWINGLGYGITGLQYADGDTQIVTPIRKLTQQPSDVSSISWSPDGRAFVYDSQGRIYIYTPATQSQRFIAEGSAPTWSPKGSRLAFRSTEDNAVIFDLEKNETKVLLSGDKIESGVHWSPDARYVMVTERRNGATSFLLNPFEGRTLKMVIYRIEDGASVSFDTLSAPGSNDAGYYWVKDYRAVIKRAAVAPNISFRESNSKWEIER